MMLGTDVSNLSTTAANAAAQGLSIVVPVYNEAAGLGALHSRLGELARTRLSGAILIVLLLLLWEVSAARGWIVSDNWPRFSAVLVAVS